MVPTWGGMSRLAGKLSRQDTASDMSVTNPESVERIGWPATFTATTLMKSDGVPLWPDRYNLRRYTRTFSEILQKVHPYVLRNCVQSSENLCPGF